MDDAEDIKLLSLVLVYTLDLDIEERVGVDTNTSGLFDVLCQPNLVSKLNLLPLFLKFLVINVVF